jgi:hypothetical protein
MLFLLPEVVSFDIGPPLCHGGGEMFYETLAGTF